MSVLSSIVIVPAPVLGATMYRWRCLRCAETSPRRFRASEFAARAAGKHACSPRKPTPKPRRVSPLEM